MIYLFAALLGLIIGLAFKGKLSNFFSIKIEKKELILAAFALQIAARILAANRFDIITQFSFVVNLCVFILLAVGIWANRNYVGIAAMGIGLILNSFVMFLNDGRMPVNIEIMKRVNMSQEVYMLQTGASSKHTILDANTKLPFLADIISPPGFLGIGARVISFGDLIIIAGLGILIFEILKRRKADV